MGRIAGTIWRPLPESSTQPKIRPTQWILHTAVDAPGDTNLGGYFESVGINLESHTWLRWAKHEQLMDTERRADANYLANRRPDGTGAVSTETEDDGSPVQRPWNDYQLDELIRTGVELNRMHGIPAVIPSRHDQPGMGWHSLFPMVWTNVAGKTCPGLTRINQFKQVVLPGIIAALDGTTEEDEMADQVVWYEKNGAHAYRVTGNVGKYLSTQAAVDLLLYLGTKESNPKGKPLDATWQESVVLVDGPCQNVLAGGGGSLPATALVEAVKRAQREGTG